MVLVSVRFVRVVSIVSILGFGVSEWLLGFLIVLVDDLVRGTVLEVC